MGRWHRRFCGLLLHLCLVCLWIGFVLVAPGPTSLAAELSDFWTAPAPTAPWAGDLSAAELFTDASPYSYRPFASRDGIGKVYMGREIAQTMGHQGAGWLERPSRATSEKPDQLIAALEIQPTDVIADIGAGTGYISFRLASRVPEGQVLAVDVQPEMLNMLEAGKQRRQVENVVTVLGTEQSPKLEPESIDLALMVDAYHEFAYPQEMMTAIRTALKPGGKVVLVEYKAENPLILIKKLHKMSQKQVRKEMEAVGLVWQGNKTVLPQQHVMVFRKTPQGLGFG